MKNIFLIFSLFVLFSCFSNRHKNSNDIQLKITGTVKLNIPNQKIKLSIFNNKNEILKTNTDVLNQYIDRNINKKIRNKDRNRMMADFAIVDDKNNNIRIPYLMLNCTNFESDILFKSKYLSTIEINPEETKEYEVNLYSSFLCAKESNEFISFINKIENKKLYLYLIIRYKGSCFTSNKIPIEW